MRAPIALAIGVTMPLLVPACAGPSRGERVSTIGVTSAELRAPAARASSRPLPMLPEEDPLYVSPADAVAWWHTLDEWRTRYPHAARTLDEWRGLHPAGARRLAAWNGAHPERLQVLVFWSVTHPEEPLGAFLLTRSGWGDLGDIARQEPEAVEAFLHWARRSGPAADELAVHPGALRYVVSTRP